MYRIERSFTISAAHSMPGDKGKCGKLHGHNFTITLTFQKAGSLGASGMVLNALELHGQISKIIETYDHTNLNESMMERPPTCEMLAHEIYGWFYKRWPTICKVRVDEGLGIAAEYEQINAESLA